jgi:hypothetical protein
VDSAVEDSVVVALAEVDLGGADSAAVTPLVMAGLLQ